MSALYIFEPHNGFGMTDPDGNPWPIGYISTVNDGGIATPVIEMLPMFDGPLVRIVALIAEAPELLAALESMMPKGICLTNRNVPDNTVVPIEATVTMGRLRELSALIARANGQ